MLPPSTQEDISFIKVARRPPYKTAYRLSLAVFLGGLFTWLAVFSLSPSGLEGSSNEARLDLEVKAATEPPVSIVLSHTFSISVSGLIFEVVDGPDRIDYSLSIMTESGREVFARTSTFEVPAIIRTSLRANSYTMTDSQDVDLPVGKYVLSLTSTHPIDYTLVQKNRLDVPLKASGVAAIFGAMFLFITVLLTYDAFKKSRERTPPAAPSPSALPLGYYSGGYHPIQPAMLPDRPPPTAAYIEEKEPVDYMCAKCGNIIQNPVVQNVITCEKCGEKEYVGLN
jgi:hypothetical protein